MTYEYRVYADGTVLMEDEYPEEDGITPLPEDYATYVLNNKAIRVITELAKAYPPELIQHIIEE